MKMLILLAALCFTATAAPLPPLPTRYDDMSDPCLEGRSGSLVFIAMQAAGAVSTKVDRAPLPPSVPVVKRPKPLLSPKAASAPKSSQMFRVASEGGSELPVLPMTMEFVVVSNVFGRYLFTASALQPANNALSFETSNALGDWQPLAYFGPVPDAQTSFVSHYSNAETLFVRAKITPIPPMARQSQTGWMPASLVPVVGAKHYINPNLPGARAWSVKR